MDSIKNGSRIAFLDGLRGVAILLVILYHAYVRWPELIPFGNMFADFPLFAYGWLGVHLFFIISGVVIFMTLEKCHNFQEFILRRWLRLFPAMLMCSIVIFATAPLFPERPAGPVFYGDLLPGITFIESSWWAKLLGLHVKDIEGAFWSLYVEVKFYVIFGILYFGIGWRKAVAALFGLFCLSTIVFVLREIAPTLNTHLASKILSLVSAEYYGWFAAGALYYKYFREGKKALLLSAIAIAFTSALVAGTYNWQSTLSAILMVVFFTFSIKNTRVQAWLTHPSLLFLGFISYPLYLLHENIMVATIIKIGHQIPSAYAVFIPIFPIALVIGLGWIVASYVEPWTREKIRPSYKRLSILVGAARRVNSALSDKEIEKI